MEFIAHGIDPQDPERPLRRLSTPNAGPDSTAKESLWVEPDYNTVANEIHPVGGSPFRDWPGPPIVMPAGLLPDGRPFGRDERKLVLYRGRTGPRTERRGQLGLDLRSTGSPTRAATPPPTWRLVPAAVRHSRVPTAAPVPTGPPAHAAARRTVRPGHAVRPGDSAPPTPGATPRAEPGTVQQKSARTADGDPLALAPPPTVRFRFNRSIALNKLQHVDTMAMVEKSRSTDGQTAHLSGGPSIRRHCHITVTRSISPRPVPLLS